MGRFLLSDKSTYKVAANAVISLGDQISVNATGFAVASPAPAAGVVGTVLGSSIENVNNTGGADGALTVTVDHSLGAKAFFFAPGNLTTANIGQTVYVGSTPQTVSSTSANAVKSGTLQGIDDDGRARVILPL